MTRALTTTGMLVTFVVVLTATNSHGTDSTPKTRSLDSSLQHPVTLFNQNDSLEYFPHHFWLRSNVFFKEIRFLENLLSRIYQDSDENGNDRQGKLPWLQFVPNVTPPDANVSRCVQDLNYLLHGLMTGELWAFTALDSWGKPGPSLLEGRLNMAGNYRQCRNVTSHTADGRFKGNYCVLNIIMADNSKDLRNIFFDTSKIELGSCMPDSCTMEEISRLVGVSLRVLNVTDTLSAGVTECRTDEREVTAATVTAIVLLSVIAITAICGTLYDLVHFQYPAWKLIRANIRLQEVRDRRSHVTQELQRTDNSPRREASRKRPALDYDSYDALETDSSDEETVTLVDQASKRLPEPSQAAWQKVLIAFSLYTNGSKLLNTTQPPGSLTAVHGIRFLSMSWVMLGHMYTYGVETFANTLTKFSALLSTWTADVIANSFVSVDTFFTLSGILVSYLVVKDYLATGKKVNWACFYFHRLWRLTPPYMMILVTVLGLQRFMGSGALWRTLQPPDKDKCETHWWLNLLYVNNLVRSREECFGHSWYLANDMQFYLITPAMLLPLLINRSVGVVVCVTLLFAHWTATATLSVVNEWPPVMLGLDVHILETSAHWMEHYYIVPWCRIGPYIIGIFTGYVLAVYEGKLLMNKMTILTGWVSTVGAGLAIVYGLRGDIGGEDPSVVGVAALYNAVARSAWGVCVAWVVVACSSGYGGPVDAILSWPPLIPLSRLTYMAYLVHPCLMRVYYGNHDMPYLLNDTNLVISYLGVLVFTYLVSFVLNLILESPMIGLEKAFIRR